MLRHLKSIFIFYIFSTQLICAKTIYILPFPGQENDNLFKDNVNSPANRDNVLQVFAQTRQALKNIGYTLTTVSSLENLENVQSIVCFDAPHMHWGHKIYEHLNKYSLDKRIVLLWEPPSVNPENYNVQYHEYFGKIYTLLDDLVDNKKYFKFYESQPRLELIDEEIQFSQKTLCVMLAGGSHGSPHPNQLYSERNSVIDYFERTAPGDFHLYGNDWPVKYQKYSVYKGPSKSKIETLKNYKFCICYENMHSLPGYITGEKILFCFVAKCIPIYWGASNITEYIPKDCFIDRRDFNSTQELHHFLQNMTEKQYNGYIERILQYLNSPQALLFSKEAWIDNFIQATVGDYDWDIAYTSKQKAILEKLYSSKWAPNTFNPKY